MATLDLVVSEFIILALVCLILVRYYKAHMVTADVAVTVYFAWVLGFVGILLLPYDVSVAVVENRHSVLLDDVWKFVYWSTFLLAWLILPIQNEYHNSGHFFFYDKLKDAFKKLFVAGAIGVAVAICYIIYMVASHSGSFSEVVGFMMACGNTYGVFIIIVLMGNGLVALPRRLWQLADYEAELQRLFITASSIESTYQDARYELEDCEADVVQAEEMLKKSGSDQSLLIYVDILETKVKNFTFEARSNSRKYVRNGSGRVETKGLDSKAGLVDLHARLIQAQIRAAACDRRWRVMLRRCKEVQELLDNSNGNPASDDSKWCEMRTEVALPVGGSAGLCHRMSAYAASIHAVCTTKCLKHLCRSGAVLCFAMSGLILWSEMLMSRNNMHSPLGSLMGAYSSSTGESTVLAQAVSFVALAYMSFCMYWSLFRMNLGWAFTLQGPQQSPPSSLIFNAEYFSRLQFPLGYNFLMILNAPRTSLTSFGLLMENITLVPVFGTSFQVYVPLFMIIVAVLTAFNVMNRLLAAVGIESDEVTGSCSCCASFRGGQRILSEEDNEKYEAGRSLVTQELRSLSGGRGGGGSERSASSRSGGGSGREDLSGGDVELGRGNKALLKKQPPSPSSTTRGATAVLTSIRSTKLFDDEGSDEEVDFRSPAAVGGRDGDDFDFSKYIDDDSQTLREKDSRGKPLSSSSSSVPHSGAKHSAATSTAAAASSSSSSSSSWLNKFGFSGSTTSSSTTTDAASTSQPRVTGAATESPLHTKRPTVPVPVPKTSAAPPPPPGAAVKATYAPIHAADRDRGKPAPPTSTSTSTSSSTFRDAGVKKPIAAPQKSFFDMIDDEADSDTGGRYG